MKLVHVPMQIEHAPPAGLDDMVAEVIGAAGANFVSVRVMRVRRPPFPMSVDLMVPDAWDSSRVAEVGESLKRPMWVLRHLPYLTPRQAIAYARLEQRVLGDDEAARMFATLRETDPTGWGPILKQIRERASDVVVQAAAQALATLVLGVGQ